MGPGCGRHFLPSAVAGAAGWAGAYTALGYLTATLTDRWLNPDPRLTWLALLTGAVLTLLWRHRHPASRTTRTSPAS